MFTIYLENTLSLPLSWESVHVQLPQTNTAQGSESLWWDKDIIVYSFKSVFLSNT